jgi:hypothetical protein
MEHITKKYISNLFEVKKINKKIIYTFHIDIAYKHLIELFETKSTTCKSGFIRCIMYKVLKDLSIPYKLESIITTKCRSLCRWCSSEVKQIFWTPKMMLCNIKKGLIIKEEVVNSFTTHLSHTSMSEITSLFDISVNDNDKLHIIDKELDEKWNVFEYCNLYTKVKKIVLIE